MCPKNLGVYLQIYFNLLNFIKFLRYNNIFISLILKNNNNDYVSNLKLFLKCVLNFSSLKNIVKLKLLLILLN